MRDNTTVNSFDFGAIRFRTKGLGLFVLSDSTKERIAALTAQEAKEANKVAWKLRKQAERLTERYSNVTRWGNEQYDHAYLNYSVAKAVCTETWKRMQAA